MIQFNIDELIKQYGPSVVAAAQRQVGVAIAQDVVWTLCGFGLLAFAVWATRREVRYWTNPDKGSFDEHEDRYLLLAGVAIVAGLLGLFVFVASAGELWTYTANPEYATLKILRGLVGK